MFEGASCPWCGEYYSFVARQIEHKSHCIKKGNVMTTHLYVIVWKPSQLWEAARVASAASRDEAMNKARRIVAMANFRYDDKLYVHDLGWAHDGMFTKNILEETDIRKWFDEEHTSKYKSLPLSPAVPTPPKSEPESEKKVLHELEILRED